MPKSDSKRLLVEGPNDGWVLAELMQANGVPWPRESEPVDIKPFGTNTPTKTRVVAQLRAANLRILGVVLDADDDAAATWIKVRSWFSESFHDLPEELPANGFVSSPNESEITLGVWIMPDNQSRGMLETLLMFLVPDDQDPLLKFAATVRDEALKLGAPFKKVHEDKAQIHTWLAWQDEPGLRLYEAVQKGVLDPTSPHSKPFVAWFRKLFEL